MAQENSISQELADLLVTNNFDPEYRDEGGQSSGPADANTISFDYRSASGNNYGSAVAVIGDDNELMLFFGDNLGRSMQDQDKDEWFAFLNQMRKLAQTHRYTFSPQNLSRLKHSLAGQAAVKEGLFEGYYGSRRESFIGEPTEARILIKHNKIIGEDDKRYRYIESIFIETADGERFKLQSNRLIHGRAMLEHVRQGGRPYDVRGNHINEMVQELSVLSRFNRAKQHHVYEGITQELVESAAHYYRSLQENLKRLSSSRGYHTYFESWAPDQIDQQESLVEDLKNMFVQQTLDTRIEAALPTLAKIQQQGTKMKEAEIFENYMNRLSEGTWALPDTPEAYEKLQQLMTGELIVGADAMNATEQLYDLVGDDELFDILNDLADNDPRANIWDDSDVQRRLAELGVQTPQSTQAAPAAVPQDTAPPAVPPVAEGDYPNDPFREIHSQGQQAGIAGKPNNNPYGEPGDSKEASYWDDGYELGLQIRRKRTGVAEAGRGSNKGYAPGFASPTAPPLRPVGGPKQDDEYVNGGPVNNIEVSINDRPWKIFPGKGPDGSKAFFQQKQDVDEMCKRKTAATGKKWSWGVTGEPATNESVEENKKGVRAVKHTTKPRNPVMAGDKPGKATVTHKNKKKDAERGIEKHKGKEPAYESRLWNALSQHLEK